MAIEIKHLKPLSEHEAAVAFFNAAEATYYPLGMTDSNAPRVVHPLWEAWIAEEAGNILGMQVIYVIPHVPHRAVGVLTYILPEARGRGVYTQMQEIYEVALAARGVNQIVSYVVAGPEEPAMSAAIMARGGWVQQIRYCRPIPYVAPPEGNPPSSP